MSALDCSWCGTPVGPDAGLRVAEPELLRGAAFCRLEHIVPWGEAGAEFGLTDVLEDDEDDGEGLGRCAQCAEPLRPGRVLLVRHQGPLRIADAFCGIDHLVDWAKAGGRFPSHS